MTFATRDVVVADLGDTFGHAQAGKRPCIFISSVQGMALLIPLTSNPDATRFEATLPIGASGVNGLTMDSVALVFQLRAIDVRKIEKRIGTLQDLDADRVNEVLAQLCRL
jgi:mRNA interferase MazF